MCLSFILWVPCIRLSRDSVSDQGVLLQCFVVSTLVSMTPANPFIFRNYELSPEGAEQARQVRPVLNSLQKACSSAGCHVSLQSISEYKYTFIN